jgi:hypothetical protein
VELSPLNTVQSTGTVSDRLSGLALKRGSAGTSLVVTVVAA